MGAEDARGGADEVAARERVAARVERRRGRGRGDGDGEGGARRGWPRGGDAAGVGGREAAGHYFFFVGEGGDAGGVGAAAVLITGFTDRWGPCISASEAPKRSFRGPVANYWIVVEWAESNPSMCCMGPQFFSLRQLLFFFV